MGGGMHMVLSVGMPHYSKKDHHRSLLLHAMPVVVKPAVVSTFVWIQSLTPKRHMMANVSWQWPEEHIYDLPIAMIWLPCLMVALSVWTGGQAGTRATQYTQLPQLSSACMPLQVK